MSSYRILALSGGGVRGVYQATILRQLDEALDRPLRQHFDLIAGTSTGALIALSIAYGLAPGSVSNLYHEHGKRIFSPRRSWLQRGPRYDQSELRAVLESYFGDATLGDLDVEVLIPATVVDHFEGRVFSRADSQTSLVEAALSSSAAPTYFDPVRPGQLKRSFADGGVWANDPSFLAVSHALFDRGYDPEHIKLLAIGTGRLPRGKAPTELARQRTLSIRTFNYLRELVAATQSWQSVYLCRQILPDLNIVRMDPHLEKLIRMTDSTQANATLPARAERDFERHQKAMTSLLTIEDEVVPPTPAVDELDPKLIEGIAAANLKRFVPARKYYRHLRDGRESISDYIGLARKTLALVSINLATGLEMERVLDTFDRLLTERASPVRISVSFLDPAKDHLLESLAPIMDQTVERLRTRIVDALIDVLDFQDSLSDELQTNFTILRHPALPMASAIMIDSDEKDGLIQLETRAYKARALDSFGFEVAAGSEFFETLRVGYGRLLKDATPVERRHLKGLSHEA